MALAGNSHREWALLGARARLHELDQERAAILKAFPQLRRAGGGTTIGSGVPALGGHRRKISTAARHAMSEGMRKYWARRKAAAKAAGKTTT